MQARGHCYSPCYLLFFLTVSCFWLVSCRRDYHTAAPSSWRQPITAFFAHLKQRRCCCRHPHSRSSRLSPVYLYETHRTIDIHHRGQVGVRFSNRNTTTLLRLFPASNNENDDDAEKPNPDVPVSVLNTKEQLAASALLLESCLIPSKDCEVKRMSSTDLAYVGDVVYELFVRTSFVWPSRRTQDLQNQVVSLVRAEFQADLLAKIRSSFGLTEKENAILSRGRNSASGVSRNRKTNPVAYQDATALEALIGFLYIDNRPRCTQLLEWMKPHLQPPITKS